MIELHFNILLSACD